MLKYYTKLSKSSELSKIQLVPLIHGQISTVSKADYQGSLPWFKRFIEYWETSGHILQQVPLADADIVVLPYDWYWYRGPHWFPKHGPKLLANAVKEANEEVYQMAVSAGKPVVLFFTGDRSHEPTPFREAITFREGMYASRSGFQDYCMPAFSEDIACQIPETIPGQRVGLIPLRKKGASPTVGFCGLAPSPKLKNRFKDVIYSLFMLLNQGRFDTSPHEGERLRYQALKILNASTAITSNFILREKSVFLAAGNASKTNARKAFISNMATSDYVLCCRGSGNFSLRIYETLCMGRIPVVIETDSRFPYDFCTDWRKYCVFVERADLKSIGERIRAHYDNLSVDAYREQQLAGRQFWEDYLSPQGFFKHFALHFNEARHAIQNARADSST